MQCCCTWRLLFSSKVAIFSYNRKQCRFRQPAADVAYSWCRRSRLSAILGFLNPWPGFLWNKVQPCNEGPIELLGRSDHSVLRSILRFRRSNFPTQPNKAQRKSLQEGGCAIFLQQNGSSRLEIMSLKSGQNEFHQ